MNRTIWEATVNRFHYDGHDQLRALINDVLAAYDLAGGPETPRAVKPCEYRCKVWTSEPYRSFVSPIHQMPGEAPSRRVPATPPR